MTRIKRQILEHDTLNYGVYHHSASTLIVPFDDHWHPEYEINYVYQGPITLFLNGQSYTLDSDQLFFINRNVIHSCPNPIIGDLHYVSILFGEEFVFPSQNDPLYQKYIAPLYRNQLGFPPTITKDTPGGKKILSAVRSFLSIYNEKPPAFEISLRNELMQLFQIALQYQMFTKYHDTKSTLNPIVHQAILTIRQNYMYPLSIHDIAAEHHVTHSYFCRLFKESVGKSPLTFLLDQRIAAATSLLTQSNESISSIAFACGFDDISYFARCFRTRNGFTPSEYRKRSRRYP